MNKVEPRSHRPKVRPTDKILTKWNHVVIDQMLSKNTKNILLYYNDESNNKK